MSLFPYASWAILIALLGICLYEAMQFRGRLAASRELVRSSVPFTYSPAQPTKRILIAGDSTATGVGAENPSLSTAGRIHEQYPNAGIVNIGISGLRTNGLLKALQQFEQRRFDLVLIQIGANDIVRFSSVTTLQHTIAEVLREAGRHSDNVMLLTSANVGTAPLFPWPLSAVYTWRTGQVRAAFLSAAQQHGAHYIDLFQPRTEDPFAHRPDIYYAADGFHPSGAGYGLWYNHMKPLLGKIMGTSS